MARPLSLAALALAGCFAPPPGNTGGTDVSPTAFGRGLVTINENDSFGSTNVSLIGLDGARLSGSFISSTSLLTGDVMVPTMPSTGADVVLLDRLSSVITWVDVETGAIRSQYHADNDELGKNPWDYIPVGPTKAYVTRYDPVPANGVHGDVIVVDPSSADVLTPVMKRIDVAPALGLAGEHRAHPARGVHMRDRAYLIVVVADPYYEGYGDSHLVVLDTVTDELIEVKALDGLRDCTAIALSPLKDELAIACSGDLHADGALSQDHSGVLLLSTADLSERGRFDAEALGAGTPGFFLSYVSSQSILLLLLGNRNAGVGDTAVQLDTSTGVTREIHRADAVAIGAVLCPGRVDGETEESLDPPACFITDVNHPNPGTSLRGALLRYPVKNATLGEPTPIVVDDVVGLPPRYLGQF